jgi:hypothetical protein
VVEVFGHLFKRSIEDDLLICTSAQCGTGIAFRTVDRRQNGGVAADASRRSEIASMAETLTNINASTMLLCDSGTQSLIFRVCRTAPVVASPRANGDHQYTPVARTLKWPRTKCKRVGLRESAASPARAAMARDSLIRI